MKKHFVTKLAVDIDKPIKYKDSYWKQGSQFGN